MASAIQQYTATPEMACMAATIQNVRGVECVVISTTGVFGDRLAGDAYNLIGRAGDHHHNESLPHIVDEYGRSPILHVTWMMTSVLPPILVDQSQITDQVGGRIEVPNVVLKE